VLNLVRPQDFNKTYNLVKFYSGGDNGPTDASYILPAFYQTWACFDTANADFWNTATTTARSWFAKAADANGMFGDQNAYSGGSPANTWVDKIRVVANIMMDWNFFAADPWQRDTYAPAYAAREKNVGANAERFCASLLGFGLPASSGKAFVDKLWSAGVPRSYWDGTLYMLALLHVSGTFHLYCRPHHLPRVRPESSGGRPDDGIAYADYLWSVGGNSMRGISSRRLGRRSLPISGGSLSS
jgi:oligosaccharide reducing-end xylanase